MIGLFAVISDFKTGRIPNPLIAGGLLLSCAWQWCVKGPPGMLSFAAGVMLPPAVLGILHYFRMLGAGDIKYYMVLGGFLGPSEVLNCIWISFLIAAVFSLAAVIRDHNFFTRLNYFVQYTTEYLETKKWKPYIVPGEPSGYLHFSLPIWNGSMIVTGGLI